MPELRGTTKGPVLTRWFGTDNLHTLDVYEGLGGYGAMRKALTTMTHDQLIDEVKASGLRGRGGADFSTGIKWSLMPKESALPMHLVVNADESEPGSAKDRYLMENSPHMLLEGIGIAAFAIRSHQAWIYIRGEYDLPFQRLTEAIGEMRGKGYLGDKPFGADWPLDIRIFRGHGAYICGEEGALLESLEGKRAQPRAWKPPYPAQTGVWGRPTTVNNVETISTVPWIIENGAAAYAKLGTEKAKGTRMFTVSGHVQRPGTYEMEIGKTYRDLIEGLAGGALPGRTIKAWWPGGSSAPVMPGDLLDTTTDLDGIKDVANLKGHPIPPLNIGGRTFATMGGSGGVIVMDDRFCAVKAAHRLLQFYAHESCGKCTPCRVGGNWAVRAYEHILSGDGGPEDIAILDRIQAGLQGGRCLCGLGDAAGWVIASSLTHFRKEYEEHALHNFCSAENGAPPAATAATSPQVGRS